MKTTGANVLNIHDRHADGLNERKMCVFLRYILYNRIHFVSKKVS